MRQKVPATQPHGQHCRLADLLARRAVPRCVLGARACMRGQECAARRPTLRSPWQVVPPAGTLVPQAHSCRCVRPPPQDEAAAVDFPGRAARGAPSRTARLRRGSPPRITPPPWCTGRWLRQDDSVSAAGRRIERCAQAAAAHDLPAETGYRWPAPWSRPWALQAGQKEARSKPLPGPADPSARRDPRAPAWLLDVAASRPARRDTPRSRPPRGSSRGSAWRDPDACLRLRPFLTVAFAVTENCQSGANQVPTTRPSDNGAGLRVASYANCPFNYIPPAGSGKTTGMR